MKITSGVMKLSVLKYLDISCNEIADEAAVAIASAIKNNPSLQHLLLNNCNIQELGIKKIANALRCISSLLSLDISNNQITAKIELEIADAVNPALQLHV